MTSAAFAMMKDGCGADDNLPKCKDTAECKKTDPAKICLLANKDKDGKPNPYTLPQPAGCGCVLGPVCDSGKCEGSDPSANLQKRENALQNNITLPS